MTPLWKHLFVAYDSPKHPPDAWGACAQRELIFGQRKNQKRCNLRAEMAKMRGRHDVAGVDPDVGDGQHDHRDAHEGGARQDHEQQSGGGLHVPEARPIS